MKRHLASLIFFALVSIILTHAPYARAEEDTGVRVGQALRESRESAHRIANLVLRMAKNLHAGFHEIFPPKSAAIEGVNAWVDPEGYRRFIASKRRAFEDEVDMEMGVKKEEPPKK
ncbi:MAG: hypothetical protein ACREOP_05945 [Thermodesulfobacteriota bacterium]